MGVKNLSIISLIFIFTLLVYLSLNTNFFTGKTILGGVCGDNQCNKDETYNTCPQDCEGIPSNSLIPQNKNCLCVYNLNSSLSQEICEYYASKRYEYSVLYYESPQEVQLLGLSIPDEGFSLEDRKEDMDSTNFDLYVRNPIIQWVKNHPELNITHLAVAKDIPIRIDRIAGDMFSGHSAVHRLALTKTPETTLHNAPKWFNGKIEHFNPLNYSERLSFAVSYLTGYTLEDVKKMIDKSTSPQENYHSLKWVIDKDTDYLQGSLTNMPPNIICGTKYTYNSHSFTMLPTHQTNNCEENQAYAIQPENIGTLRFISDTTYTYELPNSIKLTKDNSNGRDYILTVEIQTGTKISKGTQYTNNGETFTTIFGTNSWRNFSPEMKWVFNNKNNQPPGENGILTKINETGEGPNEIPFLFFVEADSEIDLKNLEFVGFTVPSSFLEVTRNILITSGIKQENIILDQWNVRPLTTNGPVIAYAGPGKYHRGYQGGRWVTYPGNFDFQSVSNKAIMTGWESFFATTFTGGPEHPVGMGWAHHGKVADATSPIGFNGTNYSKSFAGGMGTVNEPVTNGLSFFTKWMNAYANGMTLAESSMSSWKLIGKGSGKMGLTVGDPLMRISNGELGIMLGQPCTQDSECLASKCSEDRNGTKRCHTPNNKCIIGKFIWKSNDDINPNSETEFAFESENGESYCTDQKQKRTCDNGSWTIPQNCPTNTTCIGDGICALNDGENCSIDSDCVSNNCDLDLLSIKRCHEFQQKCIHNKTGKETENGLVYCINPNNKKVCNNGNWGNAQENTTCSNDYLTHRFNFEAQKKYHISLPLQSNSNLVKDLFTNLPIGSTIYTWNNELQKWEHYSSNFREGWPKTMEINPREGFGVVTPIETSIVLRGTEVPTMPIKLNGKISLFGMPTCSQCYTANKILEEINSFDNNCIKLYKWDFQNQTFMDNNITDFKITNYEAYMISCNESINLNWTPNCKDCLEKEGIKNLNSGGRSSGNNLLNEDLNSLRESGGKSEDPRNIITNTTITSNGELDEEYSNQKRRFLFFPILDIKFLIVLFIFILFIGGGILFFLIKKKVTRRNSLILNKIKIHIHNGRKDLNNGNLILARENYRIASELYNQNFLNNKAIYKDLMNFYNNIINLKN